MTFFLDFSSQKNSTCTQLEMRGVIREQTDAKREQWRKKCDHNIIISNQDLRNLAGMHYSLYEMVLVETITNSRKRTAY